MLKNVSGTVCPQNMFVRNSENVFLLFYEIYSDTVQVRRKSELAYSRVLIMSSVHERCNSFRWRSGELDVVKIGCNIRGKTEVSNRKF